MNPLLTLILSLIFIATVPSTQASSVIRIFQDDEHVYYKIPYKVLRDDERKVILDRTTDYVLGILQERVPDNIALDQLPEAIEKVKKELHPTLKKMEAIFRKKSTLHQTAKSDLLPNAFVFYIGGQLMMQFLAGAGGGLALGAVIMPYKIIRINKILKTIRQYYTYEYSWAGFLELQAGAGGHTGPAMVVGMGTVWGNMEKPQDFRGILYGLNGYIARTFNLGTIIGTTAGVGIGAAVGGLVGGISEHAVPYVQKLFRKKKDEKVIPKANTVLGPIAGASVGMGVGGIAGGIIGNAYGSHEMVGAGFGIHFMTGFIDRLDIEGLFDNYYISTGAIVFSSLELLDSKTNFCSLATFNNVRCSLGGKLSLIVDPEKIISSVGIGGQGAEQKLHDQKEKMLGDAHHHHSSDPNAKVESEEERKNDIERMEKIIKENTESSSSSSDREVFVKAEEVPEKFQEPEQIEEILNRGEFDISKDEL